MIPTKSNMYTKPQGQQGKGGMPQQQMGPMAPQPPAPPQAGKGGMPQQQMGPPAPQQQQPGKGGQPGGQGLQQGFNTQQLGSWQNPNYNMFSPNPGMGNSMSDNRGLFNNRQAIAQDYFARGGSSTGYRQDPLMNRMINMSLGKNAAISDQFGNYNNYQAAGRPGYEWAGEQWS